MKSLRRLVTSAMTLSALLLSEGAPQATDGADANPYSDTIVGRNIFGLKTPPPPPNPEDLVKKDPPPKIELQGLTTILGRRQVLYKVRVAAKPGQQAKEESFVAAEGERNGEIEVLEIDEVAGVVKFNNHGSIEPKNMKDDVAKTIAAPPAAPVQPGVPAPMIPGLPRPTAAVNPVPPNPIPTAGSTVTTFGGGAGPGSERLPVRTLRTAGSAIGGVPGSMPGQEQALPQLDPEATAVLYEANRIRNEELTRAGMRPKLPEHPFFSGAIKRLSQQQQGEPPANQP